MDQGDGVKRNTNPREQANVFSLLTFLYTREIFTRGFKKDLEDDDLFEVVRSCQSKKCADKLEHVYQRESSKENASAFKVIWKVYGLTYIGLGLINLAYKLFSVIMEPEAIAKLVEYFKPGQTTMTLYDAMYYAGIMIGLKILHCFYFENYVIYLNQLAIQIRTSFCSLIYRKALKLNPKALAEISLGNIITVITKDVLQFEGAIWLFNDLWIAIVQTFVICYLIYRKVGVASLVGIAIMLLAIPMQAYVGSIVKGLRMKINKRTDARLQITQESLSTIRIIKMYTWEKIFGERIDETRRKEMKTMMKNFYLKMVLVITSILASKIGFYALVMVYIYTNTDVSAETMFYIMRSFGTLRFALAISVSFGFTKIAELTASIRRIEKILKSEELPEPEAEKPDDEPQIDIRKISVKFGDREILKDIDLKFEVGLNVITGQLGCGKSSLIKVILKDYPVDAGEVRVRGRRSFASQDAWLFPATIKQNILFGEKYDYDRYTKVVKVCALEYDFSILEKGDDTIVADRGLNLSKGQQARVNLARAIYRDSDIYLIDDSLTALDSKVQEQIFNECIKDFLKGKLVVLVTHNAKHISKADKLVIMEDGAIKFIGKEEEVAADLLKEIEEDEFENIEKKEDLGDQDDEDEKTKLIKAPPAPKRKAVYHENKKEGSVDFDIYLRYFKFGGGPLFLLLIFLIYGVTTFTENTSQKMLSNWINTQQKLTVLRENITTTEQLILQSNLTAYVNFSDPTNNFTGDTLTSLAKLELQADKSLNFYSILMIVSTALELVKHYLILRFAVSASINIHKRMMDSVIYAKMAFFDRFFIGNILNRFSQDLNVIDEHLPMVLSMLLSTLFAVAGIIGLIATVNWKFMIPSAGLIISLVILRYLYIPTARSLKRLEAASRSPLVGHLNSTMEGLTTIRAYRAEDILRNEFDRHQDLYTSAYYTSLCIRRAFAFYMEFCSALFTTSIIGRFLFFDTGSEAGDVGLTITQVGHMTNVVQMGLMQWSETENLMTSVERVLEYTKLEEEKVDSGAEIPNWPEKGEINYVGVSLKYTNSNEKVLKDISFSVKSKEKIGIVGRTGAGKSSIISTLFRLYNYEGQIFIDDVELKTLSLKYLRQHMSIIPQDPIMFSGTIRTNIDPLNTYTDEEIWKTLHKIHLDNIIPSLELKIENSNFSTGQRQLICLARAIIKKNKIVVLDEATANMDPETEFMIQKTIVENFSQCTVFIIAHRLQSILDCHKVMVLEKGEIMEYADPLTLIEDKNSMFAQMLKNAGLNMEQIEEEQRKKK